MSRAIERTQEVVVETDEVRALLQGFQDGYSRRDIAELDAVMELFAPGDEIEVIGTNTVAPGQGEWCRGQEATRELIKDDWEDWGDVVFDVPGAHITVNGDVAWLATTARVTRTLPAELGYQYFLASAAKTLERENMDARTKMLDIVRLGSDVLPELQKGETFVWPIRFTAVAVKSKGRWRFHQMQFSYPTTRFPDVRYVE
jgi:hypothetical protein